MKNFQLRLAGISVGVALALVACSGSSSIPSGSPGNLGSPGNSTTMSSSSTSAQVALPTSLPLPILDEGTSTDTNVSAQIVQNSPTVTTVPFYSSSFTANGQTFPFQMVGTNPLLTAASTTVPVEIIPFKVVFSDGSTFDATPGATALANSPMFNNTAFPTETGQFADVNERAAFNVIGSAYHMLLGTPTILPTVTVQVPAKSGRTQSFKRMKVGFVDKSFIRPIVLSTIVADNIDPRTLPIVLVGNVFEFVVTPKKTLRNCCILGFHNAFSPSAGVVQTFAFGAYSTTGIFGGGIGDISTISHEVGEWLNDPFADNIVPPWGFPNNPSVCASNVLEVGDPIEVFPTPTYAVALNGTAYHPQDLAFFSWFARQNPSIGFNGQYSYRANLTSLPPPCS